MELLELILEDIVKSNGRYEIIVEQQIKKLNVDFTWIKDRCDINLQKINLVVAFKRARDYYNEDVLEILDYTDEPKRIVIVKDTIKNIFDGSFEDILSYYKIKTEKS